MIFVKTLFNILFFLYINTKFWRFGIIIYIEKEYKKEVEMFVFGI